MKITPSNQTLILASERGPAGDRLANLSDYPSAIGADNPVLKRVTIVAAKSNDTLVYLQADYGSATESATGTAARSFPEASDAVAATIPMDVVARGASQAVVARSPSQALSRGVELYASTQRMLSEPAAAVHIDVHA